MPLSQSTLSLILAYGLAVCGLTACHSERCGQQLDTRSVAHGGRGNSEHDGLILEPRFEGPHFFH
jgi:hypothetical protein